MKISHTKSSVTGAAIAIAAAMALVPSASAGTMRHWVCATDGGARVMSTDGWSGSNVGVPGGDVRVDCSRPGSGYLADMSVVNGAMSDGARLAWTYTAPANTSISSSRLDLESQIYGADQGASMGIVVYRGEEAYDGAHVMTNCQWFAGCSTERGSHFYDVNANRLIAALRCGGSGQCRSGERGYLWILGGFVNLVDDHAPTASPASGTITQDTVMRGGETLFFSTSDVGVGVSDVEVRIGSAVVVPRQILDGNGGKCIPVEGGYRNQVPCAQSASVALDLDTTKAPEGPQTVTATVWDAAGNQTTALSKRVVIDNKLAPRLVVGQTNSPRVNGDSSVGSVLTAADGLWLEAVSFARQWQVSDDGSTGWKAITGATAATFRPDSALVNKFVRVAVSATNPEGSTTEFSEGRRVEPANSNGGGVVAKPSPKAPGADTPGDLVANNGEGGDPASGKLVPSRKRKSTRVGYGKAVRVEGRVLDGAGRPLVGAQIDVYEQVRVKGAQRRLVTSITSDKAGGYSYKPKSESNRRVELSYSRQRGATVYQSSHGLDLKIRAAVKLRAQRTHIASRGTVVLRGRVMASDLPKNGIVVQICATDDQGRELKIGNPRTNAKGEFTWKFKFSRIRHGFVPFYARLLRTGELPAATNRSRTVKVRIG